MARTNRIARTLGRRVCVFLSGAMFNRDMTELIDAAKSVKTITFPNTVKDVLRDTFESTVVRSAVLNEGLKTLGMRADNYCNGIFNCTPLRSVTLPSTLQMLGDHTFYNCEQLRRVTFRTGSRLEKIYLYCFEDSGLEEFVAPPCLR